MIEAKNRVRAGARAMDGRIRSGEEESRQRIEEQQHRETKQRGRIMEQNDDLPSHSACCGQRRWQSRSPE